MRPAKRILGLLICSALIAPLAIAGPAQAAALGAFTTKGAWTFVSAPNLHPPKLHTDAATVSKRLAPGDFLTANFPNLTATTTQGLTMIGQGGPLILDSHLQPVWFKPSSTSVVALDLKQQTFEGKPALSWWEGVLTSAGAATSGTVFVVNQHYRQVAKLTGDTKDGWVISPHEVVISGHDAWVTSYRNVPNQDLSAYGASKNGTVYDSAVQEYDLRNGNLLFTWSAYNPGGTPHIPLSQSQAPAPKNPAFAWDAYHVNSIELVDSDHFLTSMRNTWAVYLVQISTGKIVWTLGGNGSSFTIPAADQFQWQHQALLLPNDEISIFDDHCCAFVNGSFQSPTAPSRGLILKFNLTNNTVSLVNQYLHTPALDAAFTGSMLRLPGGNALVGWGSQPYFSEYSESGRLLLDALWPNPDLSYRVLLTQNWVGTPFFAPSGAAKRKHGKTTVYASWDGATQVAAWKVLGGPNVKHLRVVGAKPKTGFETPIRLRRAFKVYKVEAVDSKGRVIGKSGAFPKAHAPASLPGAY